MMAGRFCWCAVKGKNKLNRTNEKGKEKDGRTLKKRRRDKDTYSESKLLWRGSLEGRISATAARTSSISTAEQSLKYIASLFTSVSLHIRDPKETN